MRTVRLSGCSRFWRFNPADNSYLPNLTEDTFQKWLRFLRVEEVKRRRWSDDGSSCRQRFAKHNTLFSQFVTSSHLFFTCFSPAFISFFTCFSPVFHLFEMIETGVCQNIICCHSLSPPLICFNPFSPQVNHLSCLSTGFHLKFFVINCSHHFHVIPSFII